MSPYSVEDEVGAAIYTTTLEYDIYTTTSEYDVYIYIYTTSE